MAKQEIERRGLVAMLAGAIIAVTGPSLADEAIDPQAKDAITKMGKTLSTGAFSFQSNTIRQVRKRQPAASHQPLRTGIGTAP